MQSNLIFLRFQASEQGYCNYRSGRVKGYIIFVDINFFIFHFLRYT